MNQEHQSLALPLSSQHSIVGNGLNHVIAGSGCSGTTFLAHVFYEAGVGMGGVSPLEIGMYERPVGGGMEHAEFVKINSQALSLTREGQSAKEIANLLSKRMDVKWPVVMKDPRFSAAINVWGMAGFFPKHVWLCVRDPYHILQSGQSAWGKKWTHLLYGGTFKTQFGLLVYCLEHDIPLSPIVFPRIGLDQLYAESVLRPFIPDPWPAIQRVWDPSLVHYQ